MPPGRQKRTRAAMVAGRSGGRGKCQTRTTVWRAAGAGPNGPEKARSARSVALGRPPERPEVGPSRAKGAHLALAVALYAPPFPLPCTPRPCRCPPRSCRCLVRLILAVTLRASFLPLPGTPLSCRCLVDFEVVLESFSTPRKILPEEVPRHAPTLLLGYSLRVQMLKSMEKGANRNCGKVPR